MYAVEMGQDGRWVRLGGRYLTRTDAEMAISHFADAYTGRSVKNGAVTIRRQFRIVRS